MKHILSFIFILFLLCSVTGCACLRRCPVAEQRDSTVIHYIDSVRIRDSLVLVDIPRESSSRETIAAPSDTSHLETSVAESDAWVDTTGRLHHTLDNKSGEKLPVIVPVYDRVRSTDKAISHTITITREVEKPLSWWQRCFITLGKVFLGILGAAVLFFICKIAIRLRL